MTLVSCLMVTADRPQLVRRALECFHRQTWQERELVVVDNGQQPCGIAPFDGLRYHRAAPGKPLGHYRNLSLEHARGELCAVWDDDDWYHPERLERQIQPLDARDASILGAGLWHVNDEKLQAHPFRASNRKGLCPTVVFRKNAARYPELDRGEDTELRDALYAAGSVQVLKDSHLYIRVYHGANVSGREHFVRKLKMRLLESRFRLTREELRSFEAYRELNRTLRLC